MDNTTGNSVAVETAKTIPSVGQLNRTVDKIISSNNPLDYIEKAGIDLVVLYKELNIIATSAMICAKDRDGEPLELGPDNKARIGAIALLLELAKHIKDKGTMTQVAIINDSGIMDDAKRIIAMRQGRL